MFVEFAIALSRAVRDAYGSRAEELLGIELATASINVREYSVLEVDCSPPQIAASMTSAVAFKLAKLLNDTRAEGDRAATPVDVAQQILSRFDRTPFALEAGGNGHINASLLPQFRATYAETMVRFTDAEPFFSCGSWLGSATPVSAVWDPAAARERLRSLGDSQALRLIDAAGPVPNSRDSLMLLSLLADDEIDAKVYLDGLFGRQNTPWYVRRYFEDADRFDGCAPELFDPTIDLLLRSRHELLFALRFRREERLLAHVLRLIQDFYRVFHDPRARCGGADLSDAGRREVLAVHQLRSALVRRSLESLFGANLKELLR